MKQGDKGPAVAEAQKLLSLLGYDLIIDGHFGERTRRSVTAFQKKLGIPNNGIIDEETLDSLRLAQTAKSKERAQSLPLEYPFPVVTEHRLNPNQYIRQTHPKTQLFLHFTAGGPSARNVIDYWNRDEPQIATAYLIDGNTAAVYECFHPDYWSYHLGVKGTKGRLDKRSIGIELCNYGPVINRKGRWYAWPNDYRSVVIPPERVYSLDRSFRGFHDFEAFTNEQIAALEPLIEFLVAKYNIPVQASFDLSWFDFNADVIADNAPGIWSHGTVRADKLDLYPDHRIIQMLNRIARKRR